MPFVSSRGRALKTQHLLYYALHCVFVLRVTLRHPGWKDGEVEWEPLPVNEAPSGQQELLLAR